MPQVTRGLGSVRDGQDPGNLSEAAGSLDSNPVPCCYIVKPVAAAAAAACALMACEYERQYQSQKRPAVIGLV